MFWRKKAEMNRLLFVTDLHGSTVCFRKALSLAKSKEVSYLVFGGDLCGKAMLPVIKNGNKYVTSIHDVKYELHSTKEVEEILSKIEDIGFYGCVMTQDEIEHYEQNRADLDKTFDRLMHERLEKWIEMSKKIDCPKYIIPGNDDLYNIDSLLHGQSDIICCDKKIVHLGDKHELIGLGEVVLTPWNGPRDVSEDYLVEQIEKLCNQLQNPERAIFNFHCPPHNTKLDQVMKLNENLQIDTKGGGPQLVPAGSQAIRKAIEKYQPMLTLHGHIHECNGVHRLGKTLAVNPGSQYNEGILRAALVNFDETKIKGYLMIAG